MRLQAFKIKNYRSIIDSDTVKLSEFDNVTVFAGQNESGKSSLLRALYDYERDEFDSDSLPFSTGSNPIQSVSCTYKIETGDDLLELLSEGTIEKYKLQIAEGEIIFDKDKIDKIKEFTLTKTKEGDKKSLEIDVNTFNLFRSAILDKPPQVVAGESGQAVEGETVVEPVKEKYFTIADDSNGNVEVANMLWAYTPKIVFFDDFCDLLPDRIYISALKDKTATTKGYKAVKNLEKILGVDLISKDTETDAVRRTKEDENNDEISIDFQKDWGQRIHGENKVLVKYNFEKRTGAGEDGSYINFFVETKKGQLLPPKQRSKGLIWFLSLWLELKAQNIEQTDLVLLLDEPDQHLHVKAQKDILKLINKLATTEDDKKGDQIIYATHSPYLIEVEHLSRIKLILNTEEQGTKIEDITTSKINTEYKRDALQPIADAIGLSVSEFSTLGKRNVLLEGISDFYYFSGMKKILQRNGDYSFVPGIGVRQINNLISLSIGYGLDWVAIIDDDPTVGGTDSKKKFDEIKDFVFDGDEDKTKKKVHILDGIVGIENMFTQDDLKLIDPKVATNSDKVKAVGKKRKVLFSQLFFDKVNSGEITDSNISTDAKDNFKKAFDFIDINFVDKGASPVSKIGEE
jgi:predicted ATP-dependent endonuclease of OLD family